MPIPEYMGATPIDGSKHTLVSSVGEMLLEPALHGLDASGASQRGELGLREMMANIARPNWNTLGSEYAGREHIRKAAQGDLSFVLSEAEHGGGQGPGSADSLLLRGASHLALSAQGDAVAQHNWPNELLPAPTLVHSQALDQAAIQGAVAVAKAPVELGEDGKPPQSPPGTAWVTPLPAAQKALDTAVATHATESLPTLAQIEGCAAVHAEVQVIVAYLRCALTEYAVWWARANPTGKCPLLSADPQVIAHTNLTLGMAALHLSPSVRLMQLAALKQASAIAEQCAYTPAF